MYWAIFIQTLIELIINNLRQLFFFCTQNHQTYILNKHLLLHFPFSTLPFVHPALPRGTFTHSAPAYCYIRMSLLNRFPDQLPPFLYPPGSHQNLPVLKSMMYSSLIPEVMTFSSNKLKAVFL